MKSKICNKIRTVSRSKSFRSGIAVIIILVLVLSLTDKLQPGKVSTPYSSEPLKKPIINLVFQAAKPNSDGLKQKSESHRKSLKTYPSTSIRILCYILLSRSRVKTARVIKDTWGSHCDDMLFFGGYEYPELPVTFLNVSEGYENLWGKSKAAILYLAGNAKYKDVQYFLKADDDTFVIVENLRKFIHDSSELLNKPVWFGFKLKHKRMPQGYMSGGAGYVFNYEALTRVSSILRKKWAPQQAKGGHEKLISEIIGTCNVDGEYGVEDLELGKCFLNAGVGNINTFDNKNGGERFLPLSYETLLNGAISSFHWIWSQAWNRVKTGDSCCSQDLISMHEISPAQMKSIYYLLYKLRTIK